MARVERTVGQGENQFGELIFAMHEGMVVQDSSGAILLANRRAEEILGLTKSQIEGRSSLDPRWHAIREDGRPFPGQLHPAMQTLETGLPQHNILMGVHKPCGELTWIRINSVPLFNSETDELAGVIATFCEVTDLMKMRDRIEELETMYAQVASTQLHLAEQNAMLTAVAGTDRESQLRNELFFLPELQWSLNSSNPDHPTALGVIQTLLPISECAAILRKELGSEAVAARLESGITIFWRNCSVSKAVDSCEALLPKLPRTRFGLASSFDSQDAGELISLAGGALERSSEMVAVYGFISTGDSRPA